MIKYFLWIVFIVIVLSLLLISFVGIYGRYVPVTVNRYTLSLDDKKTVVFEEMGHIGTEDFYQNVIQDIIDEKRKGSVYFYEGIVADQDPNVNEQLMKVIFHQQTAIYTVTDIQELIAKSIQLKFQQEFQFQHLVNDNDKNIDMAPKELLKILTQDTKKDSEQKSTSASEHLNDHHIDPEGDSGLTDDITKFDKMLKEASPEQKLMIAETLKTILRVFFSFNNIGHTLALTQDSVSRHLIDDRNEILAKAVIEGPDRIIITYGAGHFPGFWALLQKNNPHWKIVERKERILF